MYNYPVDSPDQEIDERDGLCWYGSQLRIQTSLDLPGTRHGWMGVESRGRVVEAWWLFNMSGSMKYGGHLPRVWRRRL